MTQSTRFDTAEQKELNRFAQPRRSRVRINLGRIAAASALMPWLTLIWFLCFAAYVHHVFGRWPQVMEAWPTFPCEEPLAYISGFLFLGCILSLPTSILLMLVQFGIRDRKGLRATLAIFVSGIVAIYLILHFDTTGFLDWWFD